MRSGILLYLLDISLQFFLIYAIYAMFHPAASSSSSFTVPSHVLPATPTLSSCKHSDVNVDSGNDAAYTLLVLLVLLLRAGLETNPGPITGAGRWEGYSSNPPPQSIKPVGRPRSTYQPVEDEKEDFKRIQEQFMAEQIEAAILLLQSWWRMSTQRRRYREEKKLIVKCQASVRGYTVRRRYRSIRNAALFIQRRYRLKEERILKAVLLLQSWSRMILQRIKYEKDVRRIIKCQAVFRQVLQRRRFLIMKAEATFNQGMSLQKQDRETEEDEEGRREEEALANAAPLAVPMPPKVDTPATATKQYVKSPPLPGPPKVNYPAAKQSVKSPPWLPPRKVKQAVKSPPWLPPRKVKTSPKKSVKAPPYLPPSLKATFRGLFLGLCGGAGDQESLRREDQQMRRELNEQRFAKLLDKVSHRQVIKALPVDMREVSHENAIPTLAAHFLESNLKKQEAMLAALLSDDSQATQAVPSTAPVVLPVVQRLETPFLCYQPDLRAAIGMLNRGNYCFVIATFNLLSSAAQFVQALQPVNEHHFHANALLVPLLRKILTGEVGMQDAALRLCRLVAAHARAIQRNDDNHFDDGQQKDLHDFLLWMLRMMKTEVKQASMLFEQLFGLRTIKTWSCNNPDCQVLTVPPDLEADPTLSLTIEATTTTLEGALDAELESKAIDRNCSCGQQYEKLTQTFHPPLPELIPIHLRRYAYDAKEKKDIKFGHRIVPMTSLLLQNCEYKLTGLAIHAGRTTSAGHYTAAQVVHLPNNRLKLRIVNNDSVFTIDNDADIRNCLDSSYVLMYSKTSQDAPTQQVVATKRRSEAGGEEEAAKKPKMANLEAGKQPKESPAATPHPLVDFIQNLKARLPVPLTTPCLETLKKKDFEQLHPLLGLTFTMQKTVRVLKAEASTVLFDSILSALEPLKSVPLQGTVPNPDKKKSRHIGQLRQAFMVGSNILQTKIFNDLLLESENPLPQSSGMDRPQPKVGQDQGTTAEKDSMTNKGSLPSVPDPPVSQQENVRPKESDSEPVSTISPIHHPLHIALFPGIKSQ